jgi:hypothetical protein
MAGPIAVIIAGSLTAWISFAGADALVVDDYYKQGKAINQDLRRDRAAAALGLQLALRYDAAAGILSGQLTRPAAGPSDGPLTLALIHPTVPAKDMQRSVTPDAAGNFSLPLPLLERAHWQVQLEDQSHQWRLHGDWRWPQQTTTSIRSAY